jgi:alpha-glucosidase
MKWTRPLTGMVACVFLSGAGVKAENAPVQTLPDGIALTVGDNQVELRVASPHAFCLHIFPQADPGAPPSIYLSGKAMSATPYTQVNEGAAVGIKAAFGELLVDPDKATWTLRDDTGATLTDWATLGKPIPAIPAQPAVPAQPATAGQAAVPAKSAVSEKPASFQLIAGIAPKLERPLFYGSGNNPTRGALTQVGVVPRTDNGSTSLPQYWSTAGYGILMVGKNDNQPASWHPKPHGAIEWTVPGPGADLYLMPASNLYDWLRDDAELTGFAPVPPLWAFGYLQSRWGWESKDYIDATFAHFRQDQLPVDTFILDFEWYTTTPDYTIKAMGDPKFIDFDWNPKLLPDPAKQIADFAQQGLHIVGIRKPRVGNSDTLAMARSKGWILPFNPSDPNGDNVGSRNVDFSNPEARAWWEEDNRKFLEAGMAGFWNDEGETNFTQYSYWNLAEVDLLKQVDPTARFWSLNRSFGPGLQRFGAAAWTGDIRADWRTLVKTAGDLLSYGLSDMPYCTCDIGGYKGLETTPELTTRWMEAGVFFPIMRSHSEKNVIPHFPWLSGPEPEAAIRKALDLRYRLIPYYYSLAHATWLTGAPLMRPLVMEFPDDANVSGLTSEWLMGRGLLAAPILNAGGARTVYLPNDQWYNFGTTQVMQGPQTVNVTAALDEIPVYVRAGTLLPLGPVLQYTGQATTEPLELQVYPGHDGTFNFVQDDGKTLAYQSGNTRTVAFSWSDGGRTLSWKITGGYRGANVFHAMKAVLFSPQGRVEKQATLDQDGSVSFN